MEILFVIVWLALCAAVGFYAEGKGRSGVGIFFLSLILSPLVGLVAAVAMRPDEKKVAAAQGKKRCPKCAEFVQPDAKICRFCRHEFAEPTEAEQLAAKGLPVGPPCPKCGGVSTFPQWEKTKASRWWKQAQVRFLCCRKCGGKWKPEGAIPVERIRESLILVSAAVGFFILLWVIAKYEAPATRTVPAGNVAPAASLRANPGATSQRYMTTVNHRPSVVPQLRS
jgi:hypothetical protein